MVASFLRQHPAYRGEIRVLVRSDQMEADRRLPPVLRSRLRPVSNQLAETLTELGATFPSLRPRLPRFYSLEAFADESASRVLFGDSDLWFRGPINGFWETEGDLVACGERTTYTGESRGVDTHRVVPRSAETEDEAKGGRLFNAGLMMISPQVRGTAVFNDLVRKLGAINWGNTELKHTDQHLLNQYFSGRVILADVRFNYLMKHHQLLTAATGVGPKDARVLHFNGAGKPWTLERWPSSLRADSELTHAALGWQKERLVDLAAEVMP